MRIEMMSAIYPYRWRGRRVDLHISIPGDATWADWVEIREHLDTLLKHAVAPEPSDPPAEGESG